MKKLKALDTTGKFAALNAAETNLPTTDKLAAAAMVKMNQMKQADPTLTNEQNC